MKILIVINSLKFGGAEKQAIVDANSLSKRGHQVKIAFNREGDLNQLLGKNVTRYRLKSHSTFLSALQLFLHLLFNRYDIIHSHMFWAGKAAAFPGKLLGSRIVFNEHGLGIWRKWYHILIIRLIAHFTDKIVNSCDAAKKIRLERENIREDKLVTIYNSFELHTQEDNGDFPGFMKNKKEFILGFVGRFNAVKRLEIFLELAAILKKKIPAFKIVLIGDGERKEKYETEIEKRNLKENFYLPGYVLNPGGYYQAFDIFLLPSKREAFSVALLEAGASGTPAIAFDVGGNSEIIKDAVTGYIIPDKNIDLLVERIFFLYQNPGKKREMGEAAKNFINNNFSVERRLEKLEKLYRELV